MTYEIFQSYKPKADAASIIGMAKRIIAEYQAQSLTLTLRQLYYQFVSKDMIPNTEKSYKKLGKILSRARLGGYVDWEAIEDRVRTPVVWREFESVEDCLEKAFRSYRLPRLQGQHTYCELWVEKDALAGVLEPVAAKYHVTMMVNRGYSSSSAMREAGERIRDCCDKYGSTYAVVFYLGDLDPSGEDMVRDIRDRLGGFLNEGHLVDWSGEKVKIESFDDMQERKPPIDLRIEKLALTMDQVDEYDPPPNPTKLTDSRAKGFIEKFGHSSWEVDALPPNILQKLITDSFEETLDMERMERVWDQETEDKQRLRDAMDSLEDT